MLNLSIHEINIFQIFRTSVSIHFPELFYQFQPKSYLYLINFLFREIIAHKGILITFRFFDHIALYETLIINSVPIY